MYKTFITSPLLRKNKMAGNTWTVRKVHVTNDAQIKPSHMSSATPRLTLKYHYWMIQPHHYSEFNLRGIHCLTTQLFVRETEKEGLHNLQHPHRTWNKLARIFKEAYSIGISYLRTHTNVSAYYLWSYNIWF